MAKTGGSTLRSILNRQFSSKEIFVPGRMRTESVLGVRPSDRVADSFRRTSIRKWAGIRLVPDHFMFGVHEAVPRPARYITMLRHPVDRVVSSYHYILGQPGIPASRRILEQKLGLDDYVRSLAGLDSHNYQTRILFAIVERPTARPDRQAWGKIVSESELPYLHAAQFQS